MFLHLKFTALWRSPEKNKVTVFYLHTKEYHSIKTIGDLASSYVIKNNPIKPACSLKISIDFLIISYRL